METRTEAMIDSECLERYIKFEVSCVSPFIEPGAMRLAWFGFSRGTCQALFFAFDGVPVSVRG